MPPVEALTPAFFFSDVHLGSATRPEERAREARLLGFLDSVRSEGRSLFCLGDLFDFWFEYDSAIPARYFEVLRRLKELSEAGVQLHFQGGNHDWWVRRGGRPGFLESELGFRLLPDAAEVDAGGLRLLLVHGDGLDPADHGYRVLKRVLRNPLAIGAFRWVHPDLAARLGALTSHTSRRAKGAGPREETCAAIRRFALETLGQRPDLDAVIAGHAHRLEETSADDGQRYLNLGDWRHGGSYAVARDGTLTLNTLPVEGAAARVWRDLNLRRPAPPPPAPDPPPERSCRSGGTAPEGR